ncbi:hypothetical protein K435DRAFT_328285 [Dendrothele bispora CBS 962.96]|uniref:Uncharacterized protein n=1 Tax=Dendrothele bispora (strain CBS 962.96) TaxID=1314807 RepID=A0A4S8MX07_DENBC|nr:hypothetical protein K435DRAFT_328285 [Dendrothele bispora CBS 962.96]
MQYTLLPSKQSFCVQTMTLFLTSNLPSTVSCSEKESKQHVFSTSFPLSFLSGDREVLAMVPNFAYTSQPRCKQQHPCLYYCPFLFQQGSIRLRSDSSTIYTTLLTERGGSKRTDKQTSKKCHDKPIQKKKKCIHV